MIAAPPQPRWIRYPIYRRPVGAPMMTQKTRLCDPPLPAWCRAPLLACGVALALLGTGCASREAPRDGAGSTPAAPEQVASADAVLRPIGGSAIRGNVSVIPRKDSVTLSISISGASPGAYRVAIHANGNCSSPNGFSAGPPLVIAGADKPIVVDFDLSFEVGVALTRRVGGIAPTSPADLNGRSVVVHYGRNGTLDAVPDVPNERVACGVLGPPQLLKLNL
jgi:Cu-Zn family superoxide dismutase